MTKVQNIFCAFGSASKNPGQVQLQPPQNQGQVHDIVGQCKGLVLFFVRNGSWAHKRSYIEMVVHSVPKRQKRMLLNSNGKTCY
jgi:hypothetical protein